MSLFWSLSLQYIYYRVLVNRGNEALVSVLEVLGSNYATMSRER
jgi:hypothetical protein